MGGFRECPCPSPPCPHAARPRPGRATTAAKERRRSVARKHSRATDGLTDCGGRDFIAFNLRYSHSSAARDPSNKMHEEVSPVSMTSLAPSPFSKKHSSLESSSGVVQRARMMPDNTKARVETGKFRHNRFQARVFLSCERGSERPPLTSSWKGRNYAARTHRRRRRGRHCSLWD